jgi:ribosomal protein L14
VPGARRRGCARRSAARGKSADDASVSDVIVATVRDARRGLGRCVTSAMGYRKRETTHAFRADRENTQIVSSF